jgi:integrase
MAVEYKTSTILNYKAKNTHWILPFWKGREIKSLTPHDVHEVVYNTAKEASWYTRKSTLKHVKHILAMAFEEGFVTRNPALAVKVKVPEVKQAVLSKTEIDVLLKEAKAVNHRFYDVWVLALLTGMCSGELYALKWTDVDFEGEKVHVARAWNSKNGFGSTKSAKHRVVPMSAALKGHLWVLKLRQEHGTEFVLPRLEEWTIGAQAQVLRDFCHGIGITSVKFHDLRATFITRLLGQGVPLAVVMAIVGHSQIKTTQAYLRLAGLELKGATDRLEIELPAETKGAKVLEFVR